MARRIRLRATEDLRLRDDVPCGAGSCGWCERGAAIRLRERSGHIVVPDAATLTWFRELLTSCHDSATEILLLRSAVEAGASSTLTDARRDLRAFSSSGTTPHQRVFLLEDRYHREIAALAKEAWAAVSPQLASAAAAASSSSSSSGDVFRSAAALASVSAAAAPVAAIGGSGTPVSPRLQAAAAALGSPVGGSSSSGGGAARGVASRVPSRSSLTSASESGGQITPGSAAGAQALRRGSSRASGSAAAAAAGGASGGQVGRTASTGSGMWGGGASASGGGGGGVFSTSDNLLAELLGEVEDEEEEGADADASGAASGAADAVEEVEVGELPAATTTTAPAPPATASAAPPARPPMIAAPVAEVPDADDDHDVAPPAAVPPPQHRQQQQQSKHHDADEGDDLLDALLAEDFGDGDDEEGEEAAASAAAAGTPAAAAQGTLPTAGSPAAPPVRGGLFGAGFRAAQPPLGAAAGASAAGGGDHHHHGGAASGNDDDADDLLAGLLAEGEEEEGDGDGHHDGAAAAAAPPPPPPAPSGPGSMGGLRRYVSASGSSVAASACRDPPATSAAAGGGGGGSGAGWGTPSRPALASASGGLLSRASSIGQAGAAVDGGASVTGGSGAVVAVGGGGGDAGKPGRRRAGSSSSSAASGGAEAALTAAVASVFGSPAAWRGRCALVAAAAWYVRHLRTIHAAAAAAGDGAAAAALPVLPVVVLLVPDAITIGSSTSSSSGGGGVTLHDEAGLLSATLASLHPDLALDVAQACAGVRAALAALHSSALVPPSPARHDAAAVPVEGGVVVMTHSQYLTTIGAACSAAVTLAAARNGRTSSGGGGGAAAAGGGGPRSEAVFYRAGAPGTATTGTGTGKGPALDAALAATLPWLAPQPISAPVALPLPPRSHDLLQLQAALHHDAYAAAVLGAVKRWAAGRRRAARMAAVAAAGSGGSIAAPAAAVAAPPTVAMLPAPAATATVPVDATATTLTAQSGAIVVSETTGEATLVDGTAGVGTGGARAAATAAAAAAAAAQQQEVAANRQRRAVRRGRIFPPHAPPAKLLEWARNGWRPATGSGTGDEGEDAAVDDDDDEEEEEEDGDATGYRPSASGAGGASGWVVVRGVVRVLRLGGGPKTAATAVGASASGGHRYVDEDDEVDTGTLAVVRVARAGGSAPASAPSSGASSGGGTAAASSGAAAGGAAAGGTASSAAPSPASASAAASALREVRLVGRRALNRALDGDEVVVQIMMTPGAATPSTGNATGIVLGVLRRRARPIIATIPLSEAQAAAIEAGWAQGQRATAVAAAAGTSSSAAGAGGSAAGQPPPTLQQLLRLGDAPAAATPSTTLTTTGSGNSGVGSERVRLDANASFDQSVLAVPMDPKLPRIRLRTRQAAMLAGYRITVAIDGWADDSAFPAGHYTGTIGRAGDIDTEVRCVMLSTGVETHARPFPAAAMACLPPLPPSKRFSVAWDRLRLLLLQAGSGSGSLQPAASAGAGSTALVATSGVAAGCQRAPTPRRQWPHNPLDRRDLRYTHAVCSVDPPGCTDIDDALSVKCSSLRGTLGAGSTGEFFAQHDPVTGAPVSSGAAVCGPLGTGSDALADAAYLRSLATGGVVVEVGVHIADVSHYVTHCSDLDQEARARGTTVYLADRRLDMLPGTLSENVCSLRARVDRYAMSTLWQLVPVPVGAATSGNSTNSVGGGFAWPAAEALAAGAAALADALTAGRVPDVDFLILPTGNWVGKTIIRSTHALTYDQAKALVARPAELQRGAGSTDADASDGGSWNPVALDVASVPEETLAAMLDRLLAGAADGAGGDGMTTAASAAAASSSVAERLLETLDPAATSTPACARRAHEQRFYPDDPAEGGLCGAPVSPVDEPVLAQRLRLLTSVARWLRRRRGATGALEFEGSEIRFKLARVAAAGGGKEDEEAKVEEDGRAEAPGGDSAAASAGGSEVADDGARPVPADGESGTPAAARAGEADASAGALPAAGAAADKPPAAGAAPGGRKGDVIPTGIAIKQQEEINNTIAELMIFANEATAKLTYAVHPQAALLRRHAPASADRFLDLVALATVAGFAVDVSSNAALAASLQRITKQLQEEEAARALAALRATGSAAAPLSDEAAAAAAAKTSLLKALTLRAMTRAEYFCTGDLAAATPDDATADAADAAAKKGALVSFDAPLQAVGGKKRRGKGAGAGGSLPAPLALWASCPLLATSSSSPLLPATAGGDSGSASGIASMQLAAVFGRPSLDASAGASGGLSCHRTLGGAFVSDLMAVPGPFTFGHYGLGLNLYTHFTSPIRRYADLAVHRLIAASVGLQSFATDGLEDDDAAAPGAGAAATAGSAGAASSAVVPAGLPTSSVPTLAGLTDIRMGDARLASSITDYLEQATMFASDGGSRAGGAGTGGRAGGAGSSKSEPSGGELWPSLPVGAPRPRPPPQPSAAPPAPAAAADADEEDDAAAASLLDSLMLGDSGSAALSATQLTAAAVPSGDAPVTDAGATTDSAAVVVDGDGESESMAPVQPPKPVPTNYASAAAFARTEDDDDDAAMVLHASSGSGAAASSGTRAPAAPLARAPFTLPALARICGWLNDRNEAAKIAGMETDDVFLCAYFATRTQVVPAIISRVEGGNTTGGGGGGGGAVLRVFIPQFAATLRCRLTYNLQADARKQGYDDAADAVLSAAAAGARVPDDDDAGSAGGASTSVVNLLADARAVPALPPALLTQRAGGGATAAALPASSLALPLPPSTRLLLQRLPAHVSRRLVDEGAVRVPMPEATTTVATEAPPAAALPSGGATGSGSGKFDTAAAVKAASTVVTFALPPSTGAGRVAAASAGASSWSARPLARCYVAVYCAPSLTHARRAPLSVELLADTPTVRALAEGRAVHPPSPSTAPSEAVATAPKTPGVAAAATDGRKPAAGASPDDRAAARTLANTGMLNPALTAAAAAGSGGARGRELVVAAAGSSARSMHALLDAPCSDAEAAAALASQEAAAARRQRAAAKKATAARPAARGTSAPAAGAVKLVVGRNRRRYGAYSPPPPPKLHHEAALRSGTIDDLLDQPQHDRMRAAAMGLAPTAGGSGGYGGGGGYASALSEAARLGADATAVGAAASSYGSGTRWGASRITTRAGAGGAAWQAAGALALAAAAAEDDGGVAGVDDDATNAWLASRFGMRHGAAADLAPYDDGSGMSAYTSRSGEGMSATDLVGSYGAMQSATAAARERMMRIAAGKRHDRIDKEKRQKK